MKNHKCDICNKQIEENAKEKITGTDFVTYGFVCEECQHEYGKERLAELLDMPGVVKVL